MAEPVTNLRQLKRSNKAPSAGDVFVMKLPEGDYLFGRVVLADWAGPMPRSNLIYVYKDRHPTLEPNWALLSPDRLLIPPFITNRLGWTKGLLQTVASRPIRPEDLLPVHCFRHFSGSYVNERGETLGAVVEPCGVFALFSYRTLDDDISEALGIAPAPEASGAK